MIFNRELVDGSSSLYVFLWARPVARFNGVGDMKDAKWYLVQIKRNAHNLAEINLVRQGFCCFQPLLKITVRKGLKFKDVSKPLFPGYLFVTFDPLKAEWQKINYTLGVARLLTRDGIPQETPTGFVHGLEGRLDSRGHLVPSKYLKEGDDVCINSRSVCWLTWSVDV